MKKLYFLCLTLMISISAYCQESFDYSVTLEEIQIPGLPGLHSYASGQHDGKWLIIGGRKDGLHARQPFNAFQPDYNNTNIYVVDINAKNVWSASLLQLPVGIREQLQSTNMNFYQDADTLIIIGGYAYAASANRHITFPNLTTVLVSSVIEAIVRGESIVPFFKQINDDVFAVTGGQIGKIENTFYLIGGQRFDGTYNPFNNPTFQQQYTNQIRKFAINNHAGNLAYSNFSAITDPVHLRRRDYNLLPQIFPDGTHGYTISSGVFQEGNDLPFLYPVDITEAGYTPVTGFNQYLSHYHGAKVCLFDSLENEMHSLFLGGMSQYFYQDGMLLQDDNVPFVKTISRLSRFSDGSLQEYRLDIDMPALQGASAEFIFNPELPHYPSKIIKLSAIDKDTLLIGHMYGGIYSPTLNPFVNNATNTTYADTSVYAVRLIRNATVNADKIQGIHPYTAHIYPNPTSADFEVAFSLDRPMDVRLFLVNVLGQLLYQETLHDLPAGQHMKRISLDHDLPAQSLFLTLVFDKRFFVTEKVAKR